MYQTKYSIKAIVVLATTFSWINVNAADFSRIETVYSGATCKHSFQGSASTPENVQYGSFGGISNHSTSSILSVTCPIPHLVDRRLSSRNSMSINVVHDKKPGAAKDATVTCSLIERSSKGVFIQSDTGANAEYGIGSVGLELSDLSFFSVRVLECRLPTHGSRITSYSVEAIHP